MSRVLGAVLVVVCCMMGAVLFYLPWTTLWEQNYFLSHFPSLMPIVLHPSFRGAVSGVGFLDIILAVSMIISDGSTAAAPSSSVRQQ
jgi:hypothetical protein